MKHSKFVVRVAALALGLTLGVASCFPEPPSGGTSSGPTGGDSNAGGAAPTSIAGGAAVSDAGSVGDGPTCTPRPKQEGAQCHPVQTAEPLVGRVVTGVPVDTVLFQTQLFTTMKSYCGGCHLAPAALGGLSFSENTFGQVVDQKVLDAIQSNIETCPLDSSGNKVDPTCFDFMPPSSAGGKKWSARQADPGDPLKPLVRLLDEWIAQGRSDTFIDAAIPGAIAPYSVSQTLADSLTNLGTCVPDAGMVGTEPTTCDTDARFAAMAVNPNGTLPERVGLPATLDQTDLISFDSAVLARNGVVAYVPTYPLWTDDAGKLRMVRVPVGQSIAYNDKTKQFDIPANTRFYKTFMKKIKGVDGVVRYHKIETRVIVSRPRDASGSDQSLFGTYEWNDDESQANLLTDPQNDGQPFVDKVKTLVIDEGVAATVQALVKKGQVRNFSYEMDSRHATRRYALPGHARCVQCHMGSPSQSFILGFTPLQLNMRACSPEQIANDGHCDTGQVDPALGDELTQVDRLTSYGVISGYGKAELQKLEDPQGTAKAPRPVRTPEELVAQGYMLGNCSHCHNPNGYPSIEHPELVPLLNFLPGEVGGIFGFPLERYSPRIFRNSTSDGPIAYISPSLRDRFGNRSGGWLPKVAASGGPATVVSDGSIAHFIDAPWRSLIYRNVDTPFTYVDDSAIYPHMPLNSPGFDCRAPRIIGEWMVSIPAVLKHPELDEDFPPTATDITMFPDTELDPQPEREVKPGDPDYYVGASEAAFRLQAFRTGLRDNNYCPDTSDIVDVTAERLNRDPPIPLDGEVPTLPIESVPDRPDWISVDLTNPPGPWNPRRADWKTIIIDQDFTAQDAAAMTLADQTSLVAQKAVVRLLQDVTLPDAKDPSNPFLMNVPFGLWQQKPGCKFDKLDCQHGFCGRLSDYDGKKAAFPHERWMDVIPSTTPADTPVYSAIPGSLVFNMICVNCHGPDADSGGRQAQTVAEMTGGVARVANFRDGLFGPFGQGTNRKSIFGSDVIAARYLPWMALGGTAVKIPSPILQLVANTPVLGESRKGIDNDGLTANMLQTAQALCKLIGQMEIGPFIPSTLNDATKQAQLHGGKISPLISDNGDSELWTSLCRLNNPAPIHALQIATGGGSFGLFFNNNDTFFPQNYGSSPIGDGTGMVQPSLNTDNTTPWCVLQPTDADASAWLSTQRADDSSGQSVALPVCPAATVAESNRFKAPVDADNHPLRGDIDDWAARGAINAGQAVFAYLNRMISQGNGRDYAYNECEMLGN